MALFGKKTPAKVKKPAVEPPKAAPPPTKAAASVPSPAVAAGAVAAAPVESRMSNAPAGACPERDPEKFDIFGNPL